MAFFYDLGTQVAEEAARALSNFANEGGAEGGYSSSPEEYAGDFEDLPGLFGKYDEVPQPEDFDGMLTGAEDLIRSLSRGELPEEEFADGLSAFANPTLDLFGTIQSQVYLWEGDAADAFYNQFLSHSTTYTQNQYLMATVLRGALLCEKDLWYNACRSVRDIGENAVSAMQDFNDGKGGVSASWVLGVIGTVIGGPVGAAGAISLLASAAGLWESTSESQVDANNPWLLADEVRSAIEKVSDDAATEEEKLIETLQANLSYMQAQRASDFTGGPGAWDLVDAAPANADSPRVIGGRR